MTRPGFWPAILFSIYVLSSAFWARPVAEALRQANGLRLALTTATFLLLAFFGRHYSWRPIPTTLVFIAYGALIYSGRLQAVEEWIHVLHVTVLVFLFDRVTKRPWLSAILGALVGAGEEVLQMWAPARVFDWKDMGLIAFSAVVSGLLLRFGIKR